MNYELMTRSYEIRHSFEKELSELICKTLEAIKNSKIDLLGCGIEPEAEKRLERILEGIDKLMRFQEPEHTVYNHYKNCQKCKDREKLSVINW